MAVAFDPKQTVSPEELPLSQVVQQEAITRLLVEKGIFFLYIHDGREKSRIQTEIQRRKQR